jgi:putative membrane protein
MKAHRLATVLTIALGTGLAGLPPAHAADAAQPPTPALSADQMKAPGFVRTAAESDLFEIESSKLALQKSTDAGVREFAQMMITDHTQSTAKLKQAVQSSNATGITVPGTLDEKHTEILDKLRQASGKSFDQVYVTMQVQGHQEAHELLSTYAKTGDDASLKNFAQEIDPIVQMHLQHAQDLAKKMGVG